jgi:hypothetical protein
MSEDSKQDIDDSPRGLAARWQMELEAARKRLKDFHSDGDTVDKRFKGKREGMDSSSKRRQLFTANVQTQMAMLYGQTPQVSATRRFADAADDVARVGGVLMERLMNADIQRDSDTYAEALLNALQDRLLPGFANARARYVVEWEEVPATPAMVDPMSGKELAPEVPAGRRKKFEDVEIDYLHWKDQLWSADARTWSEARWWAHMSLMGREALIKRFGEDIGQAIPLNHRKNTSRDEKSDPWDRAEVWEIYDKEAKKVFWFVEGYPSILDQKDDPLGLDGFYPCPKPMASNVTTSEFVPRPDFKICEDLYNQVDAITTRIDLLIDAIRVAGVYDASNEELAKLLEGTRRNQLIPVKNWHSFAEKGGIRAAVDWLPLEQIVGAIASLREERAELQEAIYQITGWSDIMRGQAAGGGVTATEQGIKARFGSVRIQQLQDEFARFASDLQRIKAEIISKHFDAETIVQRSNAEFLPEEDRALVPQAIELIKSKLSCYRIEVKPEAINLTDFAALKQERTEVLAAVASFFQAVAPIAAQMPGAMPDLLKMAQWVVSGLRGASHIEGTFDHMIAAAQQAASQPKQPPPPDPKVQAQMMKGQQDLAKIQAETQAKAQLVQLEVAADAQREENQAAWNVREHQQKQLISAALKPQPAPPAGPFNGGQR